MTPIIYILAVFYSWVAYHAWRAEKELYKYPSKRHYAQGSTSNTTGTVIKNMILYGVPFTNKKMLNDFLKQRGLNS